MKALKRLIYGWVNRKFLGGCSSYNSLKVRKSCRSKLQSREMFARLKLPHARGRTFFWPWTAYRFAKKHGFPLVIKPNVSGFSRGSYFPITSYKELLKATLLVKIWWPVSIIEHYLRGKNYRVVVIKNEIMAVIRRYPPFVDGDGTHTIEELIDQENRIREQMALYPVIHPIVKSSKTKRFLARNSTTLETVPDQGERVELFNRIALAPGGVVEIIDKETMAPDNAKMFLELLDEFDANILGIDAIFTKGIEESYLKQKGILLEVNSRPYLKMHDYPRYGEKEDLQSYFQKLDDLEIDEADIF